MRYLPLRRSQVQSAAASGFTYRVPPGSSSVSLTAAQLMFPAAPRQAPGAPRQLDTPTPVSNRRAAVSVMLRSQLSIARPYRVHCQPGGGFVAGRGITTFPALLTFPIAVSGQLGRIPAGSTGLAGRLPHRSLSVSFVIANIVVQREGMACRLSTARRKAGGAFGTATTNGWLCPTPPWAC